MVWIQVISPDQAEGQLADIYRRSAGPGGQVDQILQAHSLRPHTLQGHMALYRNTLHHSANRTPAWFLEAVGVHVSRINRCDYCVNHHEAGLRRILKDDARAQSLLIALRQEQPGEPFDAMQQVALNYVAQLTRQPAALGESFIRRMREAGWEDGDILEINQVSAYFAYANRTVLGLGVTSDGENLGEHPTPAG